MQDQLKTVQQIHASSSAFAAMLGDGSVVTRGIARFGGDSSSVRGQLKDVQLIKACGGTFAAILMDVSIVTWGILLSLEATVVPCRISCRMRSRSKLLVLLLLSFLTFTMVPL